jgi:hypothetical protein
MLADLPPLAVSGTRGSRLVLAGDRELGTINATRLCRSAAPLDVVVLMNRDDATREVHVRSRRQLEEHDGNRIFTDALHVPIGI